MYTMYMVRKKRGNSNNNNNKNKNKNNVVRTSSTADKLVEGKGSLKSEGREIRDPLQILKVRLAKGQISKKEYNELYTAISS
jgi:hypothetical protein